jgi:hypothetical protein
MTQHYFAENGDWGVVDITSPAVVSSFITIPTGHWSKSMFDAIDACLSSERVDLAKHFGINVHRIFAGECQVCKLSASELENQHLVEGVEA